MRQDYPHPGLGLWRTGEDEHTLVFAQRINQTTLVNPTAWYRITTAGLSAFHQAVAQPIDPPVQVGTLSHRVILPDTMALESHPPGMAITITMGLQAWLAPILASHLAKMAEGKEAIQHPTMILPGWSSNN